MRERLQQALNDLEYTLRLSRERADDVTLDQVTRVTASQGGAFLEAALVAGEITPEEASRWRSRLRVGRPRHKPGVEAGTQQPSPSAFLAGEVNRGERDSPEAVVEAARFYGLLAGFEAAGAISSDDVAWWRSQRRSSGSAGVGEHKRHPDASLNFSRTPETGEALRAIGIEVRAASVRVRWHLIPSPGRTVSFFPSLEDDLGTRYERVTSSYDGEYSGSSVAEVWGHSDFRPRPPRNAVRLVFRSADLSATVLL